MNVCEKCHSITSKFERSSEKAVYNVCFRCLHTKKCDTDKPLFPAIVHNQKQQHLASFTPRQRRAAYIDYTLPRVLFFCLSCDKKTVGILNNISISEANPFHYVIFCAKPTCDFVYTLSS